MDKIQKSHNKMHRAVAGILESNQQIVDTIPGLKDAQMLLSGYIEQTDKHHLGQANNGTEFTALKTDARNELNTSFIKVSRATVAFGTNSKDPSEKLFKNKYNYSDNEIKKMTEKDIFAKAYILFGDASNIGDGLLPFATKDDITKLKEDADEFNLYVPQKRVQQSKSATSTQNLEESIAKANELLKGTIDALMAPLEFMHPDFYKAYKNARIIVDPAFRKRKTEEEKKEGSK